MQIPHHAPGIMNPRFVVLSQYFKNMLSRLGQFRPISCDFVQLLKNTYSFAVANKKYPDQSVFLQSNAAKCRVLAVSALFSKSTFHIRKSGRTTEQRKSVPSNVVKSQYVFVFRTTAGFRVIVETCNLVTYFNVYTAKRVTHHLTITHP